MSVETLIIAGSVSGAAIIVITIVIIVCVVRRTSPRRQEPPTDARRGGATSNEAVYESTRRVAKDGAVVTGPPHYDNHAYDQLVHGGLKPMAPPSNYYLQAAPSQPPSYVEATAPPVSAITKSPPKLSSHVPNDAVDYCAASGIYEAMDYGQTQQNQSEPGVYLELISSAEYDNNARAPPLPAARGSSPMTRAKTPSPPTLPRPIASEQASSSSKVETEKTAVAPFSNQQLAAAMKNLKKVSK